MEKSVYEFSSTRAFLSAVTTAGGKRSGLKAELARATQCHPAFISRVLAGQAQLSLEQAERAAVYLRLSADERRYFLFFLEEERAGTQELRAFFRHEREAMLRNRSDIPARIPASERVSAENQSIYYSAWYYAAIHALVSIQAYRTIEALSKALALPSTTVRDAVHFLEKTGILTRKSGRLDVGRRHIHLDKSSPLLRQHHTHWRLQSIQRLDQGGTDDLRYSGVFSLSRKDAARLREVMLRHLGEYLETVGKSPEEILYVYCFDFFSLVE